MFLVHCCTMAATRLPVPAIEPPCKPKVMEDAGDYAREAWNIWSSGGLVSM